MKANKIKFVNKISTKVLAVVLIVLVLSLTISTKIASNFAKNRLYDSQIANLKSMAMQKGFALDQYVSDQKTIASLVKTNSTVIQQAMAYAATGEIDRVAQAAVANSLHVLYENT